MPKAKIRFQRAAALLATLCLLAAMALPVYAEAEAALPDEPTTVTTVTDTETTTPADTQEETPADPEQSAQDATEATTDPAAETQPTPDTDDPTPDQDAQPPAETPQDGDAVPDADADNPAEADTTPDIQPEAPTPDTATTLEADGTTQDAVVTYADETPQEGTYKVYFAPPQSWNATDTNVYFCAKRGNSDKNLDTEVKVQMSRVTDKATYDGRPIYEIAINYKQNDTGALCTWGGYAWVHFQIDESGTNWIGVQGGRTVIDGKWMYITDVADKCFYPKELTTSEKEYTWAAALSSWQSIDTITKAHLRYAGKMMQLYNNSQTNLPNVTATFYEKEGGNLVPVGSTINLGTVSAGKNSAGFTIPDKECAYVRFQSDNNILDSPYYNFYNEDDGIEGTKAFQYDSTTAYCLVYTSSDDINWGTAAPVGTVYFDATFSHMSYEGDSAAQVKYGMPDASGELWCNFEGDGLEQKSSKLTHLEGTELWYTTVPTGYTRIRFKSSISTTNSTSTALLDIPTQYTDPCFFADTSDNAIYNGGNRGGYWGNKDDLRDAEKGKGKEITDPVVDVAEGTFTQKSGTKYINTTLYDYYTDYELNGNNRDTYDNNDTGTQRSYVTFEQFDRAISDYYKTSTKTVTYPIYTGHFQPNGWSSQFKDVANNLDLYGWADSGQTYNTFIAVNNSNFGADGGNQVDTHKTFQGLVNNTLTNGEPTLAGTELMEPHFNKAFLQGTNSMNAVLGKVYENVQFPFTQKAVFAGESDAKYWYYDSNETTLYLKQDNTNSNATQYYLEKNTDQTRSENVNAVGGNLNTYGFFPFNETAKAKTAGNYNYGFGAKLEFTFTLTNNGKVEVKQTDGTTQEVPIKFFFAGDDDVWVFIDNQLVLDVGGAHGKAAGLLEFGADESYTPYVSDAKPSSNGGMTYDWLATGESKSVTFNGTEYNFYAKGATGTLEKGKSHTLTMYYMERGMWESNMAVAYNFPDHNEFQVEKHVDLSAVNEEFKSFFQKQKLFAFNIQNLATHYGEKKAEDANVKKEYLPDTAYANATGPGEKNTDVNYLKQVKNPPGMNGETNTCVEWFARLPDEKSEYRAQRQGTLPLGTTDNPLNVGTMKYLTFDVYADYSGNSTLSLDNMYVQLWDTSDRAMGCLNGKGLQKTDLYGVVNLKNQTWTTVKLNLSAMEKQEGFNLSSLAKITVGDNYPRHIYFRNFVFSSAPTLPTKTGFTTKQYEIPDYGSAETGNLENAKDAVFTSSIAGDDGMVDENGQFLLQDGETITFSDQFRRGSYISLKELTDDISDLYTTQWAVYEDEQLVQEMNGGGDSSAVTNPTGFTMPLQRNDDAKPRDDRTEKYKEGATDGNQIQNAYTGTKPTDANTLVFRSYANPDDDVTLTKLKVVFTNTVKTGELDIHKEAEDGSILTGEYTFTIKFTDIGGVGLGEKTITRSCKAGETIKIEGIPVGTRFEITETKTSDGSQLQDVSISGISGYEIVDGTTARGVIEQKTDDENNPRIAVVTFTNTMRKLFDLTVTKEWYDTDGTTELESDLPSEIYIQLQYRKQGVADSEWTRVPTTPEYVTVTNSYTGWNCTFTGLDKFELGNQTQLLEYRVVEGTLDESGKFTIPADGKTIVLNNYRYEAASDTYKATNDDDTTTGDITLTNTRQPTQFALAIEKRDADNTDTLLGGVEFKLEKRNGDTYEEAITQTTGDGTDGTELGKCRFTGLTPGTYRLTETKAADGYNLLAEPITIELRQDGTCLVNGTALTGGEVRGTTADGFTVSLKINNRKNFTLPHTGADAPSLWLLIGLPVCVAGLLVFAFCYNRKRH